MRRVVVTGLGLVTPCGNDVESTWDGAIHARSGITKITKFDAEGLSVQIAAEVKDLDASSVFDVKEARRTSRFVQLAAVASREAYRDAGLDAHRDNRERWGASIGVGMGGIEEIESSTLIMKEQGPRRVSPFFMPYTIANMAAGVVSRLLDLKGPNICTTTACTSGTHGVGEAFLYIRNHMADVMIAGGAESAITRLSIAAFASMKALSTNNDHPAEASRPFDLNRDGFVMGEGAGILVLEEYEHAKRRGAKIYAELVGYGMSGDAYHITAPAPEGEGAQRCMKMALEVGSVPLDQVDYINAHGTSTGLNDKYESTAIGKVFGSHAYKLAVSSTKGVTGHCLGAAGGIEAVLTVLAMHRSLIPPTANLHTPDPECPLDYTPLKARERTLRYALSNSFGFGGTNGTVAFKRFS
ncbi:MAG: beta-ketoacyl-ACP synthase II [Proteobacteria bacterium]|nr:beta-ketoacyl-ACP synthase II [Pseudomonadota bacterium]